MKRITKPAHMTEEKFEKAQEKARKIEAFFTQIFDELRRRNTDELPT